MLDMRCTMSGSDKAAFSARCRGAAMMLVLFAVAIASILALSFLRSQGPTAAIAANIDRHAEARALAESGLKLAIKYVKDNEDWRTAMSNGLWLEDQGLSGGVFSVYGTDEDGDLADDLTDSVLLSVVATVKGVTHRVSATFNPGTPVGNRLLLVVGDATTPSLQDSSKQSLFESWGYTVTIIEDTSSDADYSNALASVDVVYVSEESWSSDIGEKLRIVEIGVVNEEGQFQDDLYFALAGATYYVATTAFDLIDNSHYITSEFALGSLQIYQTAVQITSTYQTLGSGVQVLSHSPVGYSYPSLMAIEKGEALTYGVAQGRRVMLPFGDTFDINNLTTDGQTLVRRAIEWAIEDLSGESAQLLARYEFDQLLIEPSMIAHWQLEETEGGGGGLAVGDLLSLSYQALIDSYDSRLGVYGGTNTSLFGTVSTNSSSTNRVVLEDMAQIRGDVFVGNGANLNTAYSVAAGAQITGARDNLTQSVVMPALIPPGGFPATLGSVLLTTGNTVVSTDTRYQELRLTGDATITINGTVQIQIDGNLTLEGTTQIIVPSGSSLTIWSAQSISLSDQAQLNGDERATDRFTAYVFNSGGDFSLSGSTQAAGLFYIADDLILLDQSALYGSVQVGDDASISSDGSIHIDKAMSALVIEETPVIDVIGGNHGSFRGDPLGGQAGATPLVGSGFSMTFDGSGDYIEMPHIPAYALDSGTFSCWFRTDTTSVKQGLFSKDSTDYDTGGHFSVFIQYGRVRVRMQSTTASYWVDSGTIQPNTWYHIMFAWGAGGMVLYLDGIAVDTNVYTGGLSSTSGGTGNFEPIVLGGNAWGSGDLIATPVIDGFRGRLDDLRIYDERLSDSQASDLFNGIEPNGQLSEVIVEDTSGYETALNLAVEDPAKVTWSNGTLTFDQETVAQSLGDASKIRTAILATGEFSIVVRFNRAPPASTANPSRIMSISSSSGSRNVTVGQEDNAYGVRVRTTTVGSNGILSPNYQSGSVLSDDTSVHLVVTYDGTTLRAYRNGAPEMTQILDGLLTNWDSTMPLLIGNEIGGGRAWLGTIDELSIYDRALEISQAWALANGNPLVERQATVKWDEQD